MNRPLPHMTFDFFGLLGLFLLVDINTLQTIWLKDADFFCYGHLVELNSGSRIQFHVYWYRKACVCSHSVHCNNSIHFSVVKHFLQNTLVNAL